MGGQNKWLCPYSPIGWSVAAGILLGYIFIEKSLTGALLGFFIDFFLFTNPEPRSLKVFSFNNILPFELEDT